MAINLSPLFGRLPSAVEHLDVSSQLVCRFEEWKDVTIWPKSGLIRRSNREMEFEPIWGAENLKECGDFYSRWSWIPKTMKGRYFCITLHWGFNYYHWFCDVLPRFLRVIPRLDSDVIIILPPELSAWQKISLELLSLTSHRTLQYHGRRPWRVERLVYFSPLAFTGDVDGETLTEMRNSIWHSLNCAPTKPGSRKLYLTRKNQLSRRIINEDALLPILHDEGFEIIDCDQLTLPGQVVLFSEASCIVGPHGAALTNLLWAPPGTRVLEIFEPSWIRRFYWSLCMALGHDYHCAVANPCPNPTNLPNMSVAPIDFYHALKSFR